MSDSEAVNWDELLKSRDAVLEAHRDARVDPGISPAQRPDHGTLPAQRNHRCVDCGGPTSDHRNYYCDACRERLDSINPDADHDQLREKVEALEHRIALAQDTSEVARLAFEAMKVRLDAALRRIEQLELQQARWRGNERPPAPIDKEDV